MATANQMPLKVRRTIEADLDLRHIWLFILADSPRAADGLIRRLTATFDELATNPGMGRKRAELGPDLRSFPVGHYNIFYRYDSTVLLIVRVLSSYRDITRQEFFER